MKIAAIYILHHNDVWLKPSVESIAENVDAILMFICSKSRVGNLSDNDSLFKTIAGLSATHNKIKVEITDTSSEWDIRGHALYVARSAGYDYALIVDGDEVYHPSELRAMIEYATAQSHVNVWACSIVTYWKTARYKIDPPEPTVASVLINLNTMELAWHGDAVDYGCLIDACRTRVKGRCELIPESICRLHHFSWALDDKNCQYKLQSSNYAANVVRGWYENVWQRWDVDHNIPNLHPVNPPEYARAIEQPEDQIPPSARTQVLPQSTGHNIWNMRFPQCANPDVSIIIPSLNGVHLLCHLFESIINRAGLIPYEVIVVDNGSTDASRALCETMGCRFVDYGDGPFVFNRSLNTGVREARGKYVMFLNNDIVIGTADFLEIITHHLKNETVGAVGGTRVDKNHPVVACSYDVSPPGYREQRLEGACFAMRRQTWVDLGEFDENLVAYGYDELDLVIQLRRRRQWAISLPALIFVHALSSTYGEEIDNNFDNYAYLYRKYMRYHNVRTHDIPEAHFRQHPEKSHGWHSRMLRWFDDIHSFEQIPFGYRPAPGTPEPKVGIAVTTFNRCNVSKTCLESLLWSTQGSGVELFVSDAGSTDGTVDMIRATGIPFVSEPAGVAANKNRCLRQLMDAGCECLILIDDDVICNSWGWYWLYAAACRETWIKYWAYLPPQYCEPNEQHTIHRHRVSIVPCLNGVVQVIDQEVVKAIGGFHEGFGKYGGEHIDYCHRAGRAGLTTSRSAYAHLANVEGMITLLDIEHNVYSSITDSEKEQCEAHFKPVLKDRERCKLFVPYR